MDQRAAVGKQKAASGAQPSIQVFIEELMLHGFAPGSRYQIGDAVRHELERLFAEQGVPGWLSQGGEVERLDGGTFDVPSGSRAQTVGARAAQAIFGGLGK